MKSINKDIDNENTLIYKNTGVVRPYEIRFRCVLCGHGVSINDSTSFGGRSLICVSCKKRNFADDADCRKWMMEVSA